MVGHSATFGESLRERLRSLCDAHLSLRVAKVGVRLAKTVEICKAEGAELGGGNTLSFEVEAGSGMHLLPMSRVKV